MQESIRHRINDESTICVEDMIHLIDYELFLRLTAFDPSSNHLAIELVKANLRLTIFNSIS